MRLTLRTLLAYLDDLLEPAHAREIGVKISQVEYASQLVERIKDVLRRRRLTAPDLEGAGAGLDPNQVAEYLDNALPPEAVADIERVCLDSDLHLAEMAACHQILTLLLGDAVETSKQSRERLYALIPGGSGASAGANSGTNATPAAATSASNGASTGSATTTQASPRNPAGAVSISAGAGDTGSAPASSSSSGVSRKSSVATAAPRSVSAGLESRIPDSMKTRPFWQRALLPAAVIAVLAGWVGLVIFDPTFLGGKGTEPTPPGEGQVAQTANPSAKPANTEPVDAVKPAPNGTTPEPSDAGTNKSADVNGQPPGEPVAVVPPMPVPPMPVPPVDPVKPADADTPAAGPGTEIASVDGKPAVTDPMIGTPADDGMPTDPVPAVSPPVAAATIEYDDLSMDSTENLVLYRKTADSPWRVLPQLAVLRAGFELVCPPEFQGTLSVDGGRVKLQLLGPGTFRILPATATAALQLEVIHGQMIVSAAGNANDAGSVNDAAAATTPPPPPMPSTLPGAGAVASATAVPATPLDVQIGLQMGGKSLLLELADGSQVGVSCNRDEENIASLPKSGQVLSHEVWLVAGTLRVSLKDAWSLQHSGRQRLGWGPGNGVAAKPTAVPVSELPVWLDPAGSKAALTSRQYPNLLESRILASAQPLNTLTTLAKDAKTKEALAVLAVKTLGELEAWPAIVEVLALSTTMDNVRQAGITALRDGLARRADLDKELQAELEGNFQDDGEFKTGEILMQLLNGLSAEQARNAHESQLVVSWLRHSHACVRQLTIQELTALTGLHYDYKPLGTSNAREFAIRRWEKHLQEHGAILK